MNKEPLLRQMDLFIGEFTRMKESLIEDDREAMKEMMRISTERRKQFDK